MRSTLTINNNEMTEMKVTVRIFDVEGYLNATSTQTIRSHKIQNIAIDDLTKASASPAQSGNVQITYEGHAKGITGQLGSVSLEAASDGWSGWPGMQVSRIKARSGRARP